MRRWLDSYFGTVKSFEPPPWLGREVSGDPRYFNSNLVSDPYKNWRAQRD
jgi:CYTH domain-containing protein